MEIRHGLCKSAQRAFRENTRGKYEAYNYQNCIQSKFVGDLRPEYADLYNSLCRLCDDAKDAVTIFEGVLEMRKTGGWIADRTSPFYTDELTGSLCGWENLSLKGVDSDGRPVRTGIIFMYRIPTESATGWVLSCTDVFYVWKS